MCDISHFKYYLGKIGCILCTLGHRVCLDMNRFFEVNRFKTTARPREAAGDKRLSGNRRINYRIQTGNCSFYKYISLWINLCVFRALYKHTCVESNLWVGLVAHVCV